MRKIKNSQIGKCLTIFLFILAALIAGARPAGAAMVELTSMPLSSAGQDLAILSAGSTGAAFITLPNEGKLAIANFDQWEYQTITLGTGAANPWEVDVYNTTSNPRAFITGKGDNKVYVYNINSGSQQSIYCSGNPYGVAVNTTTGRVYVSRSSTDELVVYDADTLDELIVIDNTDGLDSPRGVAVNTTLNHFYVASFDNRKVYIYDGATNSFIAKVTVDFTPSRIAVNEEAGEIYVLHGTGAFSVISDSAQAVTSKTILGQTALDIAYHPDLRNLYFAIQPAPELFGYETTKGFTEVEGSPLSMSSAANSIVPIVPGPNEDGLYMLAAVTTGSKLIFVTEEDVYAPAFDGLISAVDAESASKPTLLLEWDEAIDASTPVTYKVYMAADSASFSWASDPVYTTTSFGSITLDIDALDYGTTYYLGVRAEDDAEIPNIDTNELMFSAMPSDGAAPVGGILTTATNLTTGASVQLVWTEATDVSSPIYYDVFVSTLSGSYDWNDPYVTFIDTTTGNATGLTNNIGYFFVVRARDVAGLVNENTTEYSAMPTDVFVPDFDGIGSVVDSRIGGTVQLSWTEAEDNTEPVTYHIFYNQGYSILDFVNPVTSVEATSGVVLTGLTNNLPYSFAVRAEDAVGNRETNTNRLVATPTDPTPPVFDGIKECSDMHDGSSLVIGWDAATDNSPPITYNIYVSTTYGSFNFSSIDYSVENTTGYTVPDLDMGEEYFFVVKAVDAAGNAGGSNDAIYPIDPEDELYIPCIPTDGAVPVFGGITSAEALDVSGQVLVGWDAAQDDSPPITYNIYVATQTLMTFEDPYMTVQDATSAVVTGLTDGTNYHFVVQASDNGNLTDENHVERLAMPNDGVPPVFGGITSLEDKGTYETLTASWGAASDPASPIKYHIYVSEQANSQDFESQAYMTTFDTTADVNGLTNNTGFYVAVRAEDAAGVMGLTTTELFATPTDSTPPSFSGINKLEDTGKGGELLVNWNSSSDPSTPVTYMIFMAEGGSAIVYDSPDYVTTSRPYYAQGLTNNTSYTFSVWAMDNADPPNITSNAVQMTATPTDSNPPIFSGLSTAEDAGDYGAVELGWATASDNSPPITYYVYYSNSHVVSEILAEGVKATTTLTTLTIDELTIDQYYYFLVRAEDKYGHREENNTTRGAIPRDNLPPSGFSGLQAATDNLLGGEIVLQWNAATDPSTPVSYNIYYEQGVSTSSLFYKTLRHNTTDLSYTVTSLSNDTYYTFAVRARDVYGNEDTNGIVLTNKPTDRTAPSFDGLKSMSDTGNGGELLLLWDTAEDRSTPITYNIYTAAASDEFNFSNPPDYTAQATGGYLLSGQTNGVPVYAVVTAQDSSSHSNVSDTATSPLSATPTDSNPPVFSGIDSVAIYNENGQVQLTWTAAQDNSPPIVYNIYQAQTSGSLSYDTPTYTVSDQTSYIVSGLADQQWAFFVVRAHDSADSRNAEFNVVQKSVRFRDLVGPAAPTNAQAVAGDTSSSPGDEYITITWDAPTENNDGSALVDLAGYHVLRGSFAGMFDTYVNISDGTGMIPPGTTSFVDTYELTTGNKYYYAVIALDDSSGGNQSTPSEQEIYAIPLNSDDAIPLPPDSITSLAGDGQVSLYWNRPEYNENGTVLTDLQGYYIYRSTTSGANFGLISPIIPADTLSFIDTNVENDITYYYIIKSVDTKENASEASEEITAKPGTAPDFPPGPPTDIIVSMAASTANLSWQKPELNTDGSSYLDHKGYNVYRSTDCSTSGMEQINTTLLTVESYTDTGLTSGTQYTYYITAVDLAGQESELSSAAPGVFGDEGVEGILYVRDVTQTDDKGYKLVGVSCLELEICDLSGNSLASGFTASDGSFKIIYDGNTSSLYNVQLKTPDGSGYPYSGTIVEGYGYLTVASGITLIDNDFLDLGTLTPVGTGPAVGDGDCSGKVDLKDVALIKNSFLLNFDDTGFDADADMDGSGKVDLKDLAIIKAYFNIKVNIQEPTPCVND
ncbi:MAG TPA: fibronectin type III domain-containing protein [bacterium]|nr:fibronectin type III domain-containing protein [bacterium]